MKSNLLNEKRSASSGSLPLATPLSSVPTATMRRVVVTLWQRPTPSPDSSSRTQWWLTPLRPSSAKAVAVSSTATRLPSNFFLK